MCWYLRFRLRELFENVGNASGDYVNGWWIKEQCTQHHAERTWTSPETLNLGSALSIRSFHISRNLMRQGPMPCHFTGCCALFACLESALTLHSTYYFVLSWRTCGGVYGTFVEAMFDDVWCVLATRIMLTCLASIPKRIKSARFHDSVDIRGCWWTLLSCLPIGHMPCRYVLVLTLFCVSLHITRPY